MLQILTRRHREYVKEKSPNKICSCHHQMAQRRPCCNGSMSLRVREQMEIGVGDFDSAFSSLRGEIPHLKVQKLTARGDQAPELSVYAVVAI
ncbi:hypothetical protein AVEN_136324-1 [Araneus ventricosus]|uniref:Uncharacterized protein n=1 Tax=Araneus ventricosus TaxID=182803 RepID=A0A4Y2XDM6_ARAVE|nr:hypothetical protein AVEN_136324-1 [Araneus ventricosus]